MCQALWALCGGFECGMDTAPPPRGGRGLAWHPWGRNPESAATTGRRREWRAAPWRKRGQAEVQEALRGPQVLWALTDGGRKS